MTTVITAPRINSEEFNQKIMEYRQQKNITYAPLSMGRFSSKTFYPYARDAFKDPKMLEAFKINLAGFVKTCAEKENKAEISGVREEVKETILKFPKVILEKDFNIPQDHLNLFIEEGKINLPFPKMMVIVSGKREVDDYVPDHAMNEMVLLFLAQDGDSVQIHMFLGPASGMVRHTSYDISLVLLTIRISIMLDPDTQVLNVYPQIPATQMGWIEPDICDYFIDKAMRAIYMMTHHTGEVYASIPTPRESEVNARKIRKGKKPLVEFRLITVTAKERKEPTHPGGTHASPRQHWRRGHWREYRSGRRTWVEPMLVGDEKNGKIVKDYAVGDYPHDHGNGTIRLS